MALGWYYRSDLTDLLDMAKELTKTCYQMYATQPTGLSPEIAYFNLDPTSNSETIIVHVKSLESSFHSLLLLLLSFSLGQ